MTSTAQTEPTASARSVASETVTAFGAKYRSLAGVTTDVDVSVGPKTIAVAAPTAVIKGFGVFSALTLRVGATGTPGTPVGTPAVWVALAAARREVGTLNTTKIANTTEALQTTGQLQSEEELTTAAVPTITVKTGSPSYSTGVVKGTVTAKDADNDIVEYRVDATSAAGGAVTIDQKGKFVYTPTAAVRHAASAVGAVKTDTFTVYVEDSTGNVVDQVVTVTVKPKNAKPTAAGAAVGTANPNTGVVTGTVYATDADGDALTLTGPGTTKKGSIAYHPTTGHFDYTPTPEAFAAANAPKASASAKTDKFTVTLNDGHGGIITKTVTVNLASVNQTEFTGINDGPMITDSTGTNYQVVVVPRSLFSMDTKVVIVRPDGTSTSTAALPGSYESVVVAPDGGLYVSTRKGTKLQVSVISPTGAVTTSKALTGGTVGPIVVAPDGTGYLTVGNFAKSATLSVVALKPNGAITVRQVKGIGAGDVSVGSDGYAYQAYQDKAVAKVLVIAPDGSTQNISAPEGEIAFDVTAAPGGTAYLTTTGSGTRVHVISGGAISATYDIEGDALDQGVVVAPNGRVYVFTDVSGTAWKTRITDITAGSDAPPVVVNGRPYVSVDRSLYLGSDGTGYLVLDSERIAVIRPDGTVAEVPTQTLTYEFTLGPDGRLYGYSFFGNVYAINAAGTKTTYANTSGFDELEFSPTNVPFAWDMVYDEDDERWKSQYVNLTTGAKSALIPGGQVGDSDRLVIGPDGTVYVKAEDGNQQPGQTPEVSVLAGTPDGATIAQLTDFGDSVILTPGADGVGYATVYDAATDTTKVWKLSSAGAEKIAVLPGGDETDRGVTIGANGKLYLTTFVDGGTTTKLHVIDP